MVVMHCAARPIDRQHAKGRLTARERIARLLDEGTSFFELGLWAAWGMYADWGGAPSAGVVTGVGTVAGRRVMVIANDATVKAGAFFPTTCKKVLRAQRIALENRLPLVYLVDSAGVFLPLQDEVFPDEDDFGRIFRNNAVISAAGIPQLAAIMGNCVAGGGYLPVMGDSYGAGTSALSANAFEPGFIFARPTARYTVMGGDQAASTLPEIQVLAL